MTEEASQHKPRPEEIWELHANLCSGLADPARIALLYQLAEGERNVTDLVAASGLPQSSVSRHLRVLRDRQLVNSRRQGSSIFYELADRDVVRALDLLRAVLRRRLAERGKLADAL